MSTVQASSRPLMPTLVSALFAGVDLIPILLGGALVAAGLVLFVVVANRQNYLEPEDERRARRAAATPKAGAR